MHTGALPVHEAVENSAPSPGYNRRRRGGGCGEPVLRGETCTTLLRGIPKAASARTPLSPRICHALMQAAGGGARDPTRWRPREPPPFYSPPAPAARDITPNSTPGAAYKTHHSYTPKGSGPVRSSHHLTASHRTPQNNRHPLPTRARRGHDTALPLRPYCHQPRETSPFFKLWAHPYKT